MPQWRTSRSGRRRTSQRPLPGCSSPPKDQTFYIYQTGSGSAERIPPGATGTGLGRLGDGFDRQGYVNRIVVRSLGGRSTKQTRFSFHSSHFLPVLCLSLARLQQENGFLMVLEAGKSKSRGPQIACLVRTHLGVQRRPSSQQRLRTAEWAGALSGVSFI